MPPTWGVEVQTPILDSMIARGDLNYIITAPTDKDQMVGPLKAAIDHGIKVITVDTFLGDGDYVNGPVKFPVSYIGSDNVEGGRIAARGLAKAIGGKGSSTSTPPTQRQLGRRPRKGLQGGDGQGVPEHQGSGARLQSRRSQQGDAADRGRARSANPTSRGVFGTNVFSAQGAGAAVVNAGLGGHVQVVAYDATKLAIELMNKGVVSLVLAQKPFDMGYMAVRIRGGRRRRRHQPAAPRRDRLRHHRQGQREGPGDRPLHLSDAGQVNG